MPHTFYPWRNCPRARLDDVEKRKISPLLGMKLQPSIL
jgi:hypothetical protein